MKELPHQIGAADGLPDAFRAFAAAMHRHPDGQTDTYALFDRNGRYVAHHTISASACEPSPTIHTFDTKPFSTLVAECRRDQAYRTAVLDWPAPHPKSPTRRLAVMPVLTEDDKPLAYLLCVTEREEEALRAALPLAALSLEAHIARRSERERRLEVERTAQSIETIYCSALQIYSHNDGDQVLTELMRLLEWIHPNRKFEIYLSHDQYCRVASVKPLLFRHSDGDNRFRAFTEARVVVGRNETGDPYEAVFPLRGNQGVYGVLRLEISAELPLTEEAMRATVLLAETTGNAFENARLYEQSNRLVGELRLINEITHRLNQSLKLRDIFHFASTELRTIFDADFSCILELDKELRKLIVRASEPSMFASEHFGVDYGFSGVVIETKEPIIISDYHTETNIRSIWMDETNSRSLLASPILVEGDVVGVILVAHRQENYFSYDNYKLLQTLSGHIGLAISNASLHAEVRKMAHTDRLTGLYARHYLDEQIGLFQKTHDCGSLVVVDIDNFKLINDTHGHQAGDRVLIQVSSIVRACIRDGDIASRWGGEELAVYLARVSKDQAMHVAERIRKRVAEETNPAVSVSCGVSDWKTDDEKISVESLFYRADMALYKAKHLGKNRICCD